MGKTKVKSGFKIKPPQPAPQQGKKRKLPVNITPGQDGAVGTVAANPARGGMNTDHGPAKDHGPRVADADKPKKKKKSK